MTDAQAPYSRLDRILDRLDFAWRATGSRIDYIHRNGLWMERFRPGGPHALWIAGHLSFYEAGGRRLYLRLERHPLGDWAELFGKDSRCLDDRGAYPSPESVLETLQAGRAQARAAIAELADADLDRPVRNERLAIRDVQSQIEFMVWHDAHHGGQLGAIISNHKDALGA